METPYVGFDNESLQRCAPLKTGDAIQCPRCLGEHTVKSSKNLEGKENGTLLFYRCGGHIYLAAVDGKNVLFRPPDVHGSL
jgi:hypothetical protein